MSNAYQPIYLFRHGQQNHALAPNNKTLCGLVIWGGWLRSGGLVTCKHCLRKLEAADVWAASGGTAPSLGEEI